MTCVHCLEPILPGEGSRCVAHVHVECGFRLACGSVGHIRQRCSCYGGTEEDPPHLTTRAAAMAAMSEWTVRHLEPADGPRRRLPFPP